YAFGFEAFFATQDLLMARDFFFGEHGAAAIRGAAVAWGMFARLRIVDVVIVGQFFTGSNITKGDDPDAAFDLVGLTIRPARMVDEGSHAKTIDDGFAAIHAEQISYFAVGVHPIRLSSRQTRSRIFQDVCPAGDGMSGVNPGTV